MKINLTHYYIQPQSRIFITIHFINKYIKSILILLPMIILTYPSFKLVTNHNQYKNTIVSINNIQNSLTQKTRLYESLKSKSEQANAPHTLMTNINKTLKEQLEKYHAQIEHILWKETKQIQCDASLPSHTLFPAINALVAQPNIQFINLTLTKLHKNKSVQLEALITTQEGN